jgi:CRISPR-associated endonuclease Cas1
MDDNSGSSVNIPYNLLMTQKEPILYIEFARVRMKDGILMAFSKDEQVQISPANHLLMFLGAGTSISQEAIIFAAQHNMHIAIGRGGNYIHSYWMSRRWSVPEKIVKQCSIHSNPSLRLKYSAEILKYRLIKEKADSSYFDRLSGIKTLGELMALEANWARDLYRLERIINNVDFKRDQESRQGINSRLTLLNNALYSLTTAVILNYGLHPSIGLIHGQTRRGGFSFDLADVFKYDLCINNAFKYRNCDFKFTLMKFSQNFKDHNFEKLKEMIKICSWMAGEIDNLC